MGWFFIFVIIAVIVVVALKRKAANEAAYSEYLKEQEERELERTKNMSPEELEEKKKLLIKDLIDSLDIKLKDMERRAEAIKRSLESRSSRDLQERANDYGYIIANTKGGDWDLIAANFPERALNLLRFVESMRKWINS